MEILLAIGVAMFAGLFLTRLFVKFNLPDVTCLNSLRKCV